MALLGIYVIFILYLQCQMLHFLMLSLLHHFQLFFMFVLIILVLKFLSAFVVVSFFSSHNYWVLLKSLTTAPLTYSLFNTYPPTHWPLTHRLTHQLSLTTFKQKTGLEICFAFYNSLETFIIIHFPLLLNKKYWINRKF